MIKNEYNYSDLTSRIIIQTMVQELARSLYQALFYSY